MARSNDPFGNDLSRLFRRISATGAAAALTARLAPLARTLRPAWRAMTPLIAWLEDNVGADPA